MAVLVRPLQCLRCHVCARSSSFANSSSSPAQPSPAHSRTRTRTGSHYHLLSKSKVKVKVHVASTRCKGRRQKAEGDEKYGTAYHTTHTTPHRTTPHHTTPQDKRKESPRHKRAEQARMYSPNPSLLVFRFSYPRTVISGDLTRRYRFPLADFARAVPVRP